MFTKPFYPFGWSEVRSDYSSEHPVCCIVVSETTIFCFQAKERMDTSILDLLFDLKCLLDLQITKLFWISPWIFSLYSCFKSSSCISSIHHIATRVFFFIINLFQRYIFFTTYGYISFLCFLLTNYQDISFDCIIVFYGLLS